MRKIFVITILGFAILSHAQSNYPKNSKEKKNNVKNVQSESIHEYQQPYKNISSTKLYSDNLVILRKRNSDSLAMDRKRSAQENLKNNQDTQLFHDRIEDKGNFLQFYDIKNKPIGKIIIGTSLETGNQLIINEKYLKSGISTPAIVSEKLKVISFKKDKKEGWQVGLKADISNFENFLLMRQELVLGLIVLTILIAEIFTSNEKKSIISPLAIILFAVHTVIGFLPLAEGSIFGGMFSFTAWDSKYLGECVLSAINISFPFPGIILGTLISLIILFISYFIGYRYKDDYFSKSGRVISIIFISLILFLILSQIFFYL